MKYLYKWRLKRLLLKHAYLLADTSWCGDFTCNYPVKSGRDINCRAPKIAVIELKIKFIEDKLMKQYHND